MSLRFIVSEQENPMASKLIVTHLSHDLAAKKSDLSFVWSDDPAKRLGLEVPYGTDLPDGEAAGRQALTALARELDDSQLQVSDDTQPA